LKNYFYPMVTRFTLKTLGLLCLGYGVWFFLSDQVERSSLPVSRSFEMGLAYWPPQIQIGKDVIVKKGVGITLDNSEHLLLQIPWSPLVESPLQNAVWLGRVAANHERSLTIAIDWMDNDRENVLHSAKKQWSFQEEWVEKRFLSDVSILADKYRPNFLVLGVEVDFMALKKPAIFRDFVITYGKAYRIAKLKSPTTKVSVSFQFEQIVKSNGSIISIADSPIVRSFGPLLDILGLSVYPCQLFSSPDNLADDYLSSVIPSKTKVAIFETGWPSSKRDENLQTEYVKWILQATSKISADLLVWISATDSGFSRDVKDNGSAPPCEASVDIWKHRLGLWRASGAAKSAAGPWIEWLTKIPRINVTSEAATTAQTPRDSMLRY
jgi:hypothetical protein